VNVAQPFLVVSVAKPLLAASTIETPSTHRIRILCTPSVLGPNPWPQNTRHGAEFAPIGRLVSSGTTTRLVVAQPFLVVSVAQPLWL
jgi:hypothetical protein